VLLSAVTELLVLGHMLGQHKMLQVKKIKCSFIMQNVIPMIYIVQCASESEMLVDRNWTFLVYSRYFVY